MIDTLFEAIEQSMLDEIWKKGREIAQEIGLTETDLDNFFAEIGYALSVEEEYKALDDLRRRLTEYKKGIVQSKVEWTEHQATYAEFMLRNERSRQWLEFAGAVLMLGIKRGLSIDHILYYIFESFHALTLNEIPQDIDTLEEDILRLKETRT